MLCRTTAFRPIRTPGMITEPSTRLPVLMCTSSAITDRVTVAPEMIVPVPIIESRAVPFSTNLAGGSGGG